MSMQLKIDEMLDAMRWMDHHEFEYFKEQAEALANEIAQSLAKELPVEVGEASFQGIEFAGLCVPFRPIRRGQPIPEPLIGYDDEGWEA